MITDNLMRGGKERRMIELLRSFENIANIKITLVILKNIVEYKEIFLFKNTQLIVIPRKFKKDPLVFQKLWNIVSQIGPSIIHSWGSMPSVYIVFIAFFKKIPLVNGMVVNAKCTPFSQDWIRSKITFPFSKIVLSNSQAGLKAYSVNEKKGIVVYNGFNFDRTNNLSPKELIRKQFQINTPYVVGMIAAFHPRKDYETFLQVAKEICHIRNDITFVAIGDGENRKQFQVKYEDLKNIVFTGQIQGIESVINILNVGVLLTNTSKHYEGISNAILEMMAFGIPVIATSGGGTDEIIFNNLTGYLIAPKSKEQLKSKILTLIENKTLNEYIGNKSKYLIKTKFSIDIMRQSILNLYQSNKK